MRKVFFFLPIPLILILATAVEAHRYFLEPANYIVVLKDNANLDQTTDEMATRGHFAWGEKYDRALKGYSASLTKASLADVVKDPRVKFVSEDRVVTTQAQTLPTGVRRVNAAVNPNQGDGVGVAVVDTGISLAHPDLAANIVAQTSCVRFTSGNDDNGHGSHVAGTIAAVVNSTGVVGVAPKAKLIAVKVLNRNGSGTWSQIICGLNWVVSHASAYNIKVVNMSLGGGGTSDNNCGNTNFDALHQALCRVRDAGITVVVAAGNSSTNANTFVPAAYDDAVITVSALADSDGLAGSLGSATGYGADDTFATFSNYGNVVDLAAPGVSIYSTYKGSSYATLSGTSMAAPHVSAAAALYIHSHPGSSWTDVRNALVANGEALGAGHTDPSGLHPEAVLNTSGL